MTRLGVALGARPTTFMGLSGMGDLVLTCTDDQSRNRRFGLAIARGNTPAEAARSIGQVVEGQFAAGAVRSVARRLTLEMPICEQSRSERVAPSARSCAHGAASSPSKGLSDPACASFVYHPAAAFESSSSTEFSSDA